MSQCNECARYKQRIDDMQSVIDDLHGWKFWQTMSVSNFKKTVTEMMNYIKTGVYKRL